MVKYKFSDEIYDIKPDPIPTSIEKWYFRSQRSWIVQLKDSEGNQIGEAYYCYTKGEAIEEENRLKKEYKL
jgi:hypothetical protein